MAALRELRSTLGGHKGPDLGYERDGNLPDIAKSGSLHEFLLDLHKQFGSIASFWFGPTYTVSIADPQLFKQQQHLFDRPSELFTLFMPLFGHKSLSYANGADGKGRRKVYDKCFTADAIHKYFGLFQEIADGMCKKWDTLVNDQYIPVCQYMSMFALKAALIALYWESMKDDKEVQDFKTVYDMVWSEMELRLTEPATEAREKLLQEDLLLDYTDDEELQSDDAITYVIGGFHTTGNLLAWGFYFMATHPEVREKVYKELRDKLGDGDVDHTRIGDLVYLRQVINETLRCAVVAPWAARFQEVDCELGGYKIPKNTPVIQALGVVAKDEAAWPLPDNFDPERFALKNLKTRPTLSYALFGFAGKRVCPGQRFAYAEATVLFVTILKKLKVKMVDGQVIGAVYGLGTHPSDEIWVTISRR